MLRARNPLTIRVCILFPAPTRCWLSHPGSGVTPTAEGFTTGVAHSESVTTGLVQSSYRNQSLFSNHFLEQRLVGLPDWSTTAHEKAFADIKELYEREKEFLTTDLKESQLEERFFRPIFRNLGFVFEVQEDADKSPNEPDYALFAKRRDLDDARRGKGTLDFYNKAVAVGEVKSWDCELDRLGRDRYNKRRNPSFQIWLYLKETKPKWGILTNGRKWRLYHKDRALDVFYEVDLVDYLETNNLEGFRFFYLFFRNDAFSPSKDGSIFLDQVFRGSEEYAREVGENLKENVYKALRVLAQGFFDRPENRLNPTDAGYLLEVQQNSMRLLYRLLFVFFAEGKGLLSNPAYFESEYSLHKLKREIAEKIDGGQLLLPSGKSYWTRLKNLFELIDFGSEAAGISRDQFYVPPYNGGLFDRTKNRFLEERLIGDQALAEALDLLARARTNGGPSGFVDYSTLGVRHLGSIYEGLLEYRIRVADQQMVAVGDKLLWMPYDRYKMKYKRAKMFNAFPKENRTEKDQLYLETHKGERKATGSFYTPEFVVENIVSSALGPVLEDKWDQARETGSSFLSATLSMKVLDPAMGSGHFLVGVIDYLAPRLLQAIELDLEAGHLREDETKHCTSDWAKREIASHCIYGVDLNELAVELAKVSIWLSTVSKEKPLSFLDHRLKRGNSLIGSRIVDIPWLPGTRPTGVVGQLDKPYGLLEKLLVRLQELAVIPDDTVNAVRKKENLFRQLKDSNEYQRVKAVADVHTGLHFTEPVYESIRKGYNDLVNEAYYGDPRKWHERFEMSWAKQASRHSETHSYFHWELEYPEIFFESNQPKQNPGFDSVVGNPPYDVVSAKEQKRLEGEVEIEKAYFAMQNLYLAATGGKMNYYRLFLVKAVDLLQTNGTCGFIIPMGFLGDEHSLDTRKHVMSQAQFMRVEIFPHKDNPEKRVFREAKLSTCICVFRKTRKEAKRVSFQLRVHPFGWVDERVPIVTIGYDDISKLSSHLMGFPVRPFICNDEIQLAIRIGAKNTKLSEYGTSNQGEVNVTSDSKMILKLDKRSDLPSKYSETIRGAYVNRYLLLSEPKQGEYYYLDTEEFLANSSDNETKSNDHRYPRVGYQRGSAIDNWRRIIATMIPPGKYCCDTVNYITRPNGISLEFILAFLNSALAEWRFRITSCTNHVNSYEIDNLPLPVIDTSNPPDESEVNHLSRLFDGANDNKMILDRLRGITPTSRIVHDFLSHLAKAMVERSHARLLLKNLVVDRLTTGSQDRIDALSYLASVEPDMPDNIAVIKEIAQKHIRLLGEELTRTDDLIDSVVYYMFELSDSEINTVRQSFELVQTAPLDTSQEQDE